MFRLLLLALIGLWLPAKSQGLLKSRLLLQADTTVTCTLEIRSVIDWDNPTTHYFKVATTTYLQPGYYVVQYTVDTTWLHAEYIHVSKPWTVIYKYILSERVPFKDVRFTLPKRKEDGGEYLDF